MTTSSGDVPRRSAATRSIPLRPGGRDELTVPTLAVQLYSVRDHLAELDRTLDRIAALEIADVEPFNVLDPHLRSALERHGLTARSGQFPFLSEDIEVAGQTFALPSAEMVFDAAANLGIEMLIDPMVAPNRWRSRTDVDQTAES